MQREKPQDWASQQPTKSLRLDTYNLLIAFIIEMRLPAFSYEGYQSTRGKNVFVASTSVSAAKKHAWKHSNESFTESSDPKQQLTIRLHGLYRLMKVTNCGMSSGILSLLILASNVFAVAYISSVVHLRTLWSSVNPKPLILVNICWVTIVNVCLGLQVQLADGRSNQNSSQSSFETSHEPQTNREFLSIGLSLTRLFPIKTPNLPVTFGGRYSVAQTLD